VKTITKGIYDDRDPRTTLDSDSLEAAQSNRFPVVASQKRGKDGFAIWGGMLGAVALGGLTLYLMSEARTASKRPEQKSEAPAITELEPPPVPSTAITMVDPDGNAINTPLVPASAEATVPEGPAVTPPPVASVAPPPPAALAGASETRTTDPRSPALILDDYAERLQRRGAGGAAGEVQTTAVGLNNDELFGQRAGEGGGSSSATPMANPGATIITGTLIPAVLETAINSDLPGYTRAFVSQDVRSFDNKTVLLPRGSRLIGQYKSGVAAGQTRAYVIWTRAIRPDGVSIDLGSPGTDEAGETGLPGKVNSHFFKRFGAAILLSVVGAIGSRSSNNGVVIASGTSAASVAAQSNANIPPTIRVAPGQAVKVFVARDLDFSEVMGAAL
jgi:type IV secretion system protein VirB10